MKGILGRKAGMTQVFTADGVLIPVTVVEVNPNVVMQKKTKEKDGYEAIKVGYEDVKENRANKPSKGIAAKANTAPKKYFCRRRRRQKPRKQCTVFSFTYKLYEVIGRGVEGRPVMHLVFLL